MLKAKYNRRSLPAIAVLLSLAFIQSVTMPLARAHSPAQRPVRFDNEIRVLDSFIDDWASLFKQQGALSKKAAITSTEFNAFKSGSERLRNRCSEFQTAIRDIVQKLKDADRWNGLDEELLAKTQNQRLRSAISGTGSPKRLLAEASSSFCGEAANEITGPVDGLRSKLSAQLRDWPINQMMTRVAYIPEPPKFGNSFRCTGAILRVYGRMIIGDDHVENSQAFKNWDCFCFDECSSGAATT